ncbi:MAG: chromate transporter [Firmicutes bacterium]|mgnify:CR=1 FL=1|nr:chromate transporter [Bacillota bacterium]
MRLVLDLFLTFFKIGAFTFGGGYAMLPLIHDAVIHHHGWLTQQEFLEMIAIAEMTPGPVAVNTATFVGFRIAGLWGSVFATLGVVLPSFLIILLIARFFGGLMESPWAKGFFTGVKPAIIGLIGIALWRLGGAALVDAQSVLIFLVALFLLSVRRLHPIPVIAISALCGLLLP